LAIMIRFKSRINRATIFSLVLEESLGDD